MPYSANKEQGPTVSNVSILPEGDLAARDHCFYKGAEFCFFFFSSFNSHLVLFLLFFYSNLHEEYSRFMSLVLKIQINSDTEKFVRKYSLVRLFRKRRGG